MTRRSHMLAGSEMWSSLRHPHQRLPAMTVNGQNCRKGHNNITKCVVHRAIKVLSCPHLRAKLALLKAAAIPRYRIPVSTTTKPLSTSTKHQRPANSSWSSRLSLARLLASRVLLACRGYRQAVLIYPLASALSAWVFFVRRGDS